MVEYWAKSSVPVMMAVCLVGSCVLYGMQDWDAFDRWMTVEAQSDDGTILRIATGLRSVHVVIKSFVSDPVTVVTTATHMSADQAICPPKTDCSACRESLGGTENAFLIGTALVLVSLGLQLATAERSRISRQLRAALLMTASLLYARAVFSYPDACFDNLESIRHVLETTHAGAVDPLDLHAATGQARYAAAVASMVAAVCSIMTMTWGISTDEDDIDDHSGVFKCERLLYKPAPVAAVPASSGYRRKRARSGLVDSIIANAATGKILTTSSTVRNKFQPMAPLSERGRGAGVDARRQHQHASYTRNAWRLPHLAPVNASEPEATVQLDASLLNLAEGGGGSQGENFDLGTFVEVRRRAVEDALDASLVVQCAEAERITESMRYSLMAGGKRLRPIMCLAACEMFGGTSDQAMPTAVALEMIHTMSLIHDDLPSMDNDDLRRGKPTNHVVFGEQVAILAGDALLSTSFEHVARETRGVPAERVLEVVRRLGESVGAMGLAGGQAMDLECEARNDVTFDQLRWIHTHKTAALLKVSVTAGAILGGASPEEVEALERYAVGVGLAFQVADDILDVTASTEALGKTAGKDLDADKTTYPKLLGMDGARAEAERLVGEAMGALEMFGERAEPLRAIGRYIIDRKN